MRVVILGSIPPWEVGSRSCVHVEEQFESLLKLKFCVDISGGPTRMSDPATMVELLIRNSTGNNSVERFLLEQLRPATYRPESGDDDYQDDEYLV